MKNISFEVTDDESSIIQQIVERAASMARQNGHEFETMSCHMDILATHCNGNPLRLGSLLEADDINFAHDIYGIGCYLDRSTGQLTEFFSPRFSQPQHIAAE
jgi:Family of unknown function (DUF6874)